MPIEPSENTLLALIEGELSPEDAGRAELALEASPQLRRMIEAMSRDRAALAELEEPEVPRDFVAELEPLLARPLLVEGAFRPGVLRRRRRREARRRAVRRLAVAAAVLLAVSAGLVAAGVLAVGGMRWLQRGGGLEQLASAPALRPAEPIRRSDAVPIRTVLELSGGTVHHRWRVEAMPTPAAQASSSPTAVAAAPLPPRPLDFALVVTADVEPRLVEAIERLAGEHQVPAALVRNLTMEEARRIEQRWLADMARRDPGSAPDAVAVFDPVEIPSRPRLNELIHRVEVGRRSQDEAASGVVVGSRDLMPAYGEQLAFSDRGATLTIAVPISELSRLLELVHGDVDADATLRLLRDPDDEEAASALADRPAIVRRLDALVEAGEGIVWLPVVCD